MFEACLLFSLFSPNNWHSYQTSPKKKGKGSSDDDSDMSDVSVDLQPRERTTSRRAAGMCQNSVA